MTFSGSATSAVAATFGKSMAFGIYSQITSSTQRFDSMWTAGRSLVVWNSGTTSASYSYDTYSGSSAASNIIVTSVYGMRYLTMTVGSTLAPGNYMFASWVSTSSNGYSALVSLNNAVVDGPLIVGMGPIGSATANSLGLADAGVFSTTTNALPSTLALSQIVNSQNVIPYFRLGAI
jgi:hypothetical protein